MRIMPLVEYTVILRYIYCNGITKLYFFDMLTEGQDITIAMVARGGHELAGSIGSVVVREEEAHQEGSRNKKRI